MNETMARWIGTLPIIPLFATTGCLPPIQVQHVEPIGFDYKLDEHEAYERAVRVVERQDIDTRLSTVLADAGVIHGEWVTFGPYREGCAWASVLSIPRFRDVRWEIILDHGRCTVTPEARGWAPGVMTDRERHAFSVLVDGLKDQLAPGPR